MGKSKATARRPRTRYQTKLPATTPTVTTRSAKANVNATPAPPRLTQRVTRLWTLDERIALCVLVPVTRAKPGTRVRVFNETFRKEHTKAGYPQGRDQKSLRAAWSDRGRVAGRRVWGHIFRGSGGVDEGLWDAIERRLKVVAAKLGVEWKESGGEVKGDEADDNREDGSEESDADAEGETDEEYAADANNSSEAKGVERLDSAHEAATSTPEAARPAETTPDLLQSSLTRDLEQLSLPDNMTATVTATANHFTQGPKPTTVTDTTTSPPLPMIHSNNILWSYNKPYLIGQPAPIQPTSQPSHISGKVQRVITGPRNRTTDYVLCTPSLCIICGPASAYCASSPTAGYPLVHSADIQRRGGEFVFEPAREVEWERRSAVVPESRLRRVVFGDGGARAVRVCVFEKCWECGGEALARMGLRREEEDLEMADA